jgi:hypothetical protein
LLRSIRDVSREDHEEEGDEVRRGGEALSVNWTEAHFSEDGREENREGAKGDIAGEVHQGCEIVLFA